MESRLVHVASLRQSAVLASAPFAGSTVKNHFPSLVGKDVLELRVCFAGGE